MKIYIRNGKGKTRIEIGIQFGYEQVKYSIWTCYVQQRSEIGKRLIKE